MATKREREEFCYDSLKRFIVSNLRIADYALVRLKEEKGPPDAYLTIDHSTFAVEVTSTEVMRDVSIGEGRLQEETYEHSHTQFIKKVEEAAQRTGILKGAYLVRFNRPMTDPRHRQIRDRIQESLIQYIEQTQELATAADEVIRHGDQRICRISKLNNQRNIIHHEFDAFTDSATDLAWDESPEVASKVCSLLQDAVMKKKEKFLTKGKTHPSVLSFPRVLLILNTYPLVNASMYLNCTRLIPSLDFFHSVFIVGVDASCSLISTSDEAWSRAPRHSET